MTSAGESAVSGSAERLQDPSPDQAVFALDLIDVLQEPSVASVLAIDRGEGVMGQLNQYAQQTVLGYKAVQAYIGNTEAIKNVDVFESMEMGAVTHSLRAVNDLYSMLGGAATALGIERDTFIKSFPRLCIDNAPQIMLGIMNDFNIFCQRGLIGPDGSTENYQEAAKRLRLLNLVLLFSPQVDETERIIQTFTETLYNGTHPSPIASEERVKRIVDQLGGEISYGDRLADLTRRLSPTQRLNVFNRACEYLLLNNAAAQFTQLEDIPGTRRAYQRAFRAIADRGVLGINERVVGMIRRLEEPVNEEENVSDIVDAARLNWEVLPEGELEERARAILGEVGRATGKQPEIALERLVILSNIRERWGRDRSFYAFGQLGTREAVKAGDQEQPDRYILLILQEYDDDGLVVAEHVVAESPIAGPNALYVFRQDVSDGRRWQNVMALPKKYARALKARQVKHSMARGQSDLISVMTDKVIILLECQTEDFSDLEFSGAAGGKTRIRLPRRALVDDSDNS